MRPRRYSTIRIYVLLVMQFAFLSLSTPQGIAQAQQGAYSASRKTVLENEHVLVVESIYPPGSGVVMHSHRSPHVAYVVEGGTVETKDAKGVATRTTLTTGQTMWREAQSHSSKNVGSTTLHIIEVEIKSAAPSTAGVRG